jgi:hypothetical protein
VRLEGLGQLKNPTTSLGINLPACSIVPQPTTLLCAPINVLLIFLTLRPNREEVTGRQTKEHNKNVHNLFSSPNTDIIKRVVQKSPKLI